MARVDLSPNGMMSSSSLPHRRPPRKHKTGSERSLDLTAAIRSDSASPTSASEMASADTSHDAFASVAGVTLAESQYPSLLGQTEAAPATNIDWFPTPLPFESELLQSMQSVQESVWGQDISLPGFHWMNNMQPDSSDVYMKSGNSMYNGPMFDLNYFDMKISAPWAMKPHRWQVVGPRSKAVTSDSITNIVSLSYAAVFLGCFDPRYSFCH